MAPTAKNATGGFTLIEALVAMAILAMVVLGLLGTRSDAMVDALEARNWRLSRELAEQLLSELKAGAREMPPQSGSIVPFEEYPGFSYQMLVGEEQIAAHEADAVQDESEASYDVRDRLGWQRDRDQQRLARQKGLSVDELQRQRLAEEDKKDEIPSESDLEDVAVVVYFPDVRVGERNKGELAFTLKAKVSTLAINGLTPDQAQAMANAKGVEYKKGNQPPGAASTGTGANGGGAPAGSGKTQQTTGSASR